MSSLIENAPSLNASSERVLCKEIILSGNRVGLECGKECAMGKEMCAYHYRQVASMSPASREKKIMEAIEYRERSERMDRERVRILGIEQRSQERERRRIEEIRQRSADIEQFYRQTMDSFSEPRESIYATGNAAIPSFDSFLTGVSSYANPFAYKDEASKNQNSLVDELVGSLLDTGKCTMSTGECPICYDDDANLISLSCHEKHIVCVSCLKNIYQSKFVRKVVCPHCRCEEKSVMTSRMLPIQNEDPFFSRRNLEYSVRIFQEQSSIFSTPIPAEPRIGHSVRFESVIATMQR